MDAEIPYVDNILLHGFYVIMEQPHALWTKKIDINGPTRQENYVYFGPFEEFMKPSGLSQRFRNYQEGTKQRRANAPTFEQLIKGWMYQHKNHQRRLINYVLKLCQIDQVSLKKFDHFCRHIMNNHVLIEDLKSELVAHFTDDWVIIWSKWVDERINWLNTCRDEEQSLVTCIGLDEQLLLATYLSNLFTRVRVEEIVKPQASLQCRKIGEILQKQNWRLDQLDITFFTSANAVELPVQYWINICEKLHDVFAVAAPSFFNENLLMECRAILKGHNWRNGQQTMSNIAMKLVQFTKDSQLQEVANIYEFIKE